MTTSIREEDLDTANTAEESREGPVTEGDQQDLSGASSSWLHLNTFLMIGAVVHWSLVVFLYWR